MSTTTFVRLKKGKPKIPRGKDNYGDSYPYIRDFLHKVARKLGVDSPRSFEYEDPEFYAEIFPPDELPPAVRRKIRTQKQWHPAYKGHRTFAAMLEYFRDGGPRLDRALEKENIQREVLIYQFEVFVHILGDAAEKKDMFRIEAG